MANPTSHPLPPVRADLLLLHPPAFFDFRDRSDIYFPYLSTSGDVPITPLYEYFPLGFKSLQRSLAERGYDVRILNLSTLLLKYPGSDLESALGAVEVSLFGIDLHWMVHVQGSLAVAELLKRVHPDVPVIFGGISSTYYADQLIRYPAIDMVMRGYDTHQPMAALMHALVNGRAPEQVPNLVWKTPDGRIVKNDFSYKPKTFSCNVDWSKVPEHRPGDVLPIMEILTTQTAGCVQSCGWCGGSRDAFRRVNSTSRAAVRSPLPEIAAEFETVARLPDRESYHLYSVGTYNEPRQRLRFYLDRVAEAGFKSVSYEQFHLTPEADLRAMVKAHPRTIITLSPESHDMRVAKAAGRGVYTPEEMERWIAKALELGIYEIDIWYFIGMPYQDAHSVSETVDYCRRLLEMFKGQRVVPLLCPMIPFLDPASSFFEEPERHGYRVFYRTVEEHRQGMTRASIINRTNYETKWLSRSDLVHEGYAAIRSLTQIKAELGFFGRGIARSVVARIDDALEFIDAVHAVDCIAEPNDRARQLAALGPDILRRNQVIFGGGVSNQAVPIQRQIGGRWFDELLWPTEALEAAQGCAAASPS